MNKQCQQCSKTFQITKDDQEFYDKMNAPEPTLCVQCRRRNRLGWRNESTLYARACDLCSGAIISMYPEEAPFLVYCQKCFWSDKWDPLMYGQTYDESRPFFEQFAELQNNVPRLAILNKQSENSDYCNYSFANKNCYLTFGSHYEEGCLYGRYSTKNTDCLDYLWLYQSELSYQCLFSKNVYNSVYLDHCDTVRDSYFSVDLKGCNNCVFSSNLRNKQYYIFNKPYTEEKYFKELEKLELHTRTGFAKALDTYMNEVRKKFPFRAYYITKSEDCEGTNHQNSQRLRYSFDCSDSEDCAYGFQLDNTHTSMDMNCMGYDTCELCYQTIGCTGVYDCIACDSCWHGNNLRYCSFVFNSSNCFGSISLQKKEYCILNTQYTKDEYEKLVGKIQKNMQEAGEWGDFFPLENSPFAYNETIAQEQLPLSESEVKSRGLQWYNSADASRQKSEYIIPDSIEDVDEKITQHVLTCENCSKGYKIVPQELEVYKKIHIPIPEECPACRHQERFRLRNPLELWHGQCMCTQPEHDHKGRCSEEFETTYSPDRVELVYCEQCYMEESL